MIASLPLWVCCAQLGLAADNAGANDPDGSISQRVINKLSYQAALELDSVDMLGEAFGEESAELVYREYHVLNAADKEHAVYYRDVAGETFVEKFIDYNRSYTAPNFQQQDFRTGTVITSSVEDNELTLIRGSAVDKDSMRTTSEYTVTSEKTLPSTSSLVIDAGFDHFIRQQWEALLAGEIITFDLAVPARRRTISMEVKIIDPLACVAAMERYLESSSYNDSEIACFQLAVEGWLINKFVDPITLSYRRDTRQLLAFKGLSNIKNDSDDSQNVYISYRYF